MPTKATNTFTSYALTTEESRKGAILSALNKLVVQNLRSKIAEEKLALTFTPNDTLSFTQQEAYLRGQLDILAYLLDMDEDANQFYNSYTTSTKE